MVRLVFAVLLVGVLPLTVLPGCVAAIGNRGYSGVAMTPAARPLLEERIEGARRVLELQQRRLDETRTQFESGTATSRDVVDAEIAVEEARIRLLLFRAELMAAGDADKD